jgi:hypothetical protein
LALKRRQVVLLAQKTWKNVPPHLKQTQVAVPPRAIAVLISFGMAYCQNTKLSAPIQWIMTVIQSLKKKASQANLDIPTSILLPIVTRISISSTIQMLPTPFAYSHCLVLLVSALIPLAQTV